MQLNKDRLSLKYDSAQGKQFKDERCSEKNGKSSWCHREEICGTACSNGGGIMLGKTKWVKTPGLCEACGRVDEHFCPVVAIKKQRSVSEMVAGAMKDLLPDFIKKVRADSGDEKELPVTEQSEVDVDKSVGLDNTVVEEQQLSEVSVPVSVEPVPQEKVKKPATKPWDSGENPWKRDVLRLKKKRPGFRARWVDPRNFERNLEDGWAFAEKQYYGDVSDKIAGEEKQMDSRIRRRGMILMEINEAAAKERETYYADRASKMEKSIMERHEKDAEKSGVETYDPVSYQR